MYQSPYRATAPATPALKTNMDVALTWRARTSGPLSGRNEQPSRSSLWAVNSNRRRSRTPRFWVITPRIELGRAAGLPRNSFYSLNISRKRRPTACRLIAAARATAHHATIPIDHNGSIPSATRSALARFPRRIAARKPTRVPKVSQSNKQLALAFSPANLHDPTSPMNSFTHS